MGKFNWVIVGTGVVGREMAAALNAVNGEIYGVYNHHPEKAEAFAKEFGAKKVFYSEEEMLADEKVDIFYVSTPHNAHYDFMMKAIRAKKHVFCEKSITVNAKQLDEAAALAEENGVVIAEAMTMFHMPLYRKLREIIDSGVLGKIKLVQVNFGSCKEYDVTNRFFNKDLAGGALLDIGVYAISFARFFLESKPNTILTTANYFETGVDEESGILMKNDRGQLSVIALTMRAKQPKRGVVAGEKGYIEVNNYPRADKATITYTESGKAETIEAGSTAKAMEYEVIDMDEAVSGNKEHIYFPLTKDVSHLMSEVRNQWGFVYPFEK